MATLFSNTKLGLVGRSRFEKFDKRLVIICCDPRRVRPRCKFGVFAPPLHQKKFTRTRLCHQILRGTVFDGFDDIKNLQLKAGFFVIFRRICKFETRPDAPIERRWNCRAMIRSPYHWPETNFPQELHSLASDQASRDSDKIEIKNEWLIDVK